MKLKIYSILLLTASVFTLEAQVATTPQNGVAIQNQIDVKTPTPATLANTPVGSLDAFKKGQLFYNAVPQTPAIGTSLKIIDSKKDTDYLIKTYKRIRNNIYCIMS